MRRLSSISLALALFATASALRAEDSREPAGRITPALAAVVWTAAQLVPSPMIVAGSGPVGAGVRWQVTPFVYSFGVAAHPVRAFVVEPVARHSGAFELFVSPEYACCAKNDGTGWMARGGGRVYLPVMGRGELLSASLGGSYYRAAGGDGAAVEIGAYTFFSIIGLTVTVSPTLAHREVITALTFRYF